MGIIETHDAEILVIIALIFPGGFSEDPGGKKDGYTEKTDAGLKARVIHHVMILPGLKLFPNRKGFPYSVIRGL